MPYIQLDVPNNYPVEVKRNLARRLGDHYARFMRSCIRTVGEKKWVRSKAKLPGLTLLS